jgi:hypothetical protein
LKDSSNEIVDSVFDKNYSGTITLINNFMLDIGELKAECAERLSRRDDRGGPTMEG